MCKMARMRLATPGVCVQRFGCGLQQSRVGASPLSAVLWVCRSALATALVLVFFSLLLVAGIVGLVSLLDGVFKRQAEKQLNMEAAHIAKHLVSMEPEGYECCRAACYA